MVLVLNEKSWNLKMVKGQKWHYVSWTPYTNNALSNYASMSWVYAICMQAARISEKQLCFLFNEIDRNGETGSFIPNANITIMPSLRFRRYSTEQKKCHIEDVKKDQETVNADSIYWDCRFEDKKIAEELFTLLSTDEYWCEENNYIIK